jgi:hypothetical protein
MMKFLSKYDDSMDFNLNSMVPLHRAWSYRWIEWDFKLNVYLFHSLVSGVFPVQIKQFIITWKDALMKVEEYFMKC